MSKQTKLFWIVASGAIVWMFVMRPFTPGNIVQFEFAKSVEQAQNIINDWGAAGVATARISIYLDFVFLILYSWAISLGCKVVIESNTPGWLKRAGEYLSTIIWFAGSCDLIENFAMLFTLSEINEFSVSAAYYFALFKFVIVLVCLLFIIATPILKMIFIQKS